MTRKEKLEKAATKYAQDKYLPVQTAQSFKAGAKWSDEHPVNYDGKAMLHILEKGVKQGKRELTDKACKWLRKELVNFEDYSGMGEELISDFRKAMSNETK